MGKIHCLTREYYRLIRYNRQKKRKKTTIEEVTRKKTISGQTKAGATKRTLLFDREKTLKNITIHMPQKWILSSNVKCIFRETRANSILVKECIVFIADCDAQCDEKLRI